MIQTMPGNLQPLDEKFPIVDANGQPTLYFIKWAQQRQIDITAGITAAQAQALIDSWAAARDVIAGSGLTGGGPLSADVTLAADVQAILNSLSTTQGTVLYRGASVWAGLAPGTSGQFLKTNGAGANPEWAAAGGGGGGYTLIEDRVLASNSSSETFSSISGSYTDLRLVVEARQNTGGVIEFYVRPNNDTGANYSSYVENRFGTATYTDKIRFGCSESSAATASVFAPSEGFIYGYSSASRYKTVLSKGFFPSSSFEDRNSAVWRSTSAITSLVVFPGSNSFVTGTRLRLYGF